MKIDSLWKAILLFGALLVFSGVAVWARAMPVGSLQDGYYNCLWSYRYDNSWAGTISCAGGSAGIRLNNAYYKLTGKLSWYVGDNADAGIFSPPILNGLGMLLVLAGGIIAFTRAPTVRLSDIERSRHDLSED
jgi:hypothetical protein